jgi:bacillithiol biosynthesis cysteine-adding enzyme BshC
VASLFDAYVSGAAGAFFETHFADPDHRRRVRARVRPMGAAVAEAVARQNAGLRPCAARAASIQALRAGAPAVVTGQQMGLFLGPLFTIYKAASAVRVARALAEAWGEPVVPVFWLQTEDHDAAEIAHVSVPSRHGAPLRLSVPVSAHERRSVGALPLPEEVAACTAHLREALAGLPHAEAHGARLEACYAAGKTWAGAFAQLLAQVFEGTGLVLVEPRDPALARHAATVHRRALGQATPLADALGERAAALIRAGFELPVHVRPGAPLCFFHPSGGAGPRFRLEGCAEGWREVGGAGLHTTDAVLRALEVDPLCCSASALLRPVIQDTLLPTVAYIGGPGEIAYFAQLAPLYAGLDVPMPLVVPRVRIRLIEAKARAALTRLGVTPADAALELDALLARAHAHAGADAIPLRPADLSGDLLRAFSQALDAHAPALLAAGDGMQTAIDKTRRTVEMAVEKLSGRLEKALLHRDGGLVEEARRLQGWLHPDGVPQERLFGYSYFAARYGERPWLERILAAAAPFEARVQDVDLP